MEQEEQRRSANFAQQYENHGRYLGPFVAPWRAWDKSWERWKTYDEGHFAHAIYHQLLELAECDDEHKPKELVDIISITLNWMRRLGMEPEDIAQTVMDRARTRYSDTDAILDKYVEMRERGEA
jgi:hypothetical protein